MTVINSNVNYPNKYNFIIKNIDCLINLFMIIYLLRYREKFNQLYLLK